jgi:cell division protease FtsH
MATSLACLVGSGLSTQSNKITLGKDVNGRHPLFSRRYSSLRRASKTILVKASLDQREHEGRRGFLKFLNVTVGLPALLGSAKAYADEQGVSSSKMSYSRFLEYLDNGRVKKS